MSLRAEDPARSRTNANRVRIKDLKVIETEAPGDGQRGENIPWGQRAADSKLSLPIGTRGSLPRAARRVSMRSIGSLERLAWVRFLTLPSSR